MDEWAAAHPTDPDRDALVARSRAAREIYLRWGRDTVGWGLYLYRKR